MVLTVIGLLLYSLHTTENMSRQTTKPRRMNQTKPFHVLRGGVTKGEPDWGALSVVVLVSSISTSWS